LTDGRGDLTELQSLDGLRTTSVTLAYMQHLREYTDRAFGRFRPAGFHRRTLTQAMSCAAVGLMSIGVLTMGAPTGAAAADADSMGVSILSPVSDQFVSGSSVTVSGTTPSPGTVTVNASTGGSCVVDASESSWSCTLSVSSGTVTLTAEARPAAPDAVASPQPSAAPDAVEAGAVTVHVLNAPTLEGSSPLVTQGSFIGMGYPHAGISLLLTPTAGGSDHSFLCPPVDANGRWTCVTTPESGHYTVAATQFDPTVPSQRSPSTDAIPVRIDLTPPPAPVIASPRSGEQLGASAVVSGTGVEGGRVDVYVDDLRSCSATVSGGAWSCTASGLSVGQHSIQALQFDPAGNFSTLTPPIPVSVIGPPPASPSSPATSDAPPTSTPTDPVAPSDGGQSAATPPGGTSSEATSSWRAPPRIGRSVPTMSTALEGDSGLAAILVALAFVVLIAIPLRAVATVAHAHLRRPNVRLFGRNQRRVDSPPFGRSVQIAAVSLCLLAVSAVSAIPGWQGGTADLRFTMAMAVGVTLLNVLAPVIARWTPPRLGLNIQLNVRPELLMATAVTSLVSGALDLHPPALVGVFLVASAATATRSNLRMRRALALIQVVGVVALSLAAWLAHGALLAGSGVWNSALSELAASICIGGLASAVILMIPVGRLPGRDLFQSSRILWAAVALPAVVLAAGVLDAGFDARTFWVIAASVGIAAVCSAILIWVRWVDPAIDG
jgi:hypothetical protein